MSVIGILPNMFLYIYAYIYIFFFYIYMHKNIYIGQSEIGRVNLECILLSEKSNL